jgi:N-formylmaleamate deformylase
LKIGIGQKFITKSGRYQTSMSAFQVLKPPNPEYKQLVSTIDVPSLLVIGNTGVVSLFVAEELRSLNPRLHIEKIAEVGHGLHYDRPERFVIIVKSFLRQFNIMTSEKVD